MKKNILIPTDFSKNAWNAITYAADLYKDHKCSFTILNTFGSLGYSTADLMVPELGTKSYDTAKETSEKGLKKVETMLDFRGKNLKHEYVMVSQYGDLLSVMKNTVEKKDIELIIMGTKGAGNNRGALLGSNTILSMEKIRNCPTLGIPLDVRYTKIKEIVFPTSYKTHYKRRELQYLIDIALLQDATICVLHTTFREELSQKEEENKALLTKSLEGATFSFHNLSSSDPVRATQIFVESRKSNMIALINKKHAFFGSVFTTPMVKELGMFSTVPLLVMHDMRN